MSNQLQEQLPFQESREAKECRMLRQYIGKLEHDLFFLYVFLSSNDLCSEAADFLSDREEDPSPICSASCFGQF